MQSQRNPANPVPALLLAVLALLMVIAECLVVGLVQRPSRRALGWKEGA